MLSSNPLISIVRWCHFRRYPCSRGLRDQMFQTSEYPFWHLFRFHRCVLPEFFLDQIFEWFSLRFCFCLTSQTSNHSTEIVLWWISAPLWNFPISCHWVWGISYYWAHSANHSAITVFSSSPHHPRPNLAQKLIGFHLLELRWVLPIFCCQLFLKTQRFAVEACFPRFGLDLPMALVDFDFQTSAEEHCWLHFPYYCEPIGLCFMPFGKKLNISYHL